MTKDFGHYSGALAGWLASLMFVSAEQTLTVSFADASARFAQLVSGAGLNAASREIYDGGVAYLLRAGPAGPVPGASRLVRVLFTEPAYRDDEVTVGLRWEAAGMTGGLFPALDADIRLTAAGDQEVRVTLTGSYRPPLGAGLDQLLLHDVATATIGALLTQVAGILEDQDHSYERRWLYGPSRSTGREAE
ncbi:MAG: hypothetical protein JO345_14880 [Streptosporangiaceae bacterium]|nr:hypothetical protein [Streptosporangiaceae bacterium]